MFLGWEKRHVLWFATLDGAFGHLLPCSEKTYRRLLMLQNVLGTIHILHKHFYSTKLNLTFKFFTKTEFFRQIKRISFSTLRFDEIFMLPVV